MPTPTLNTPRTSQADATPQAKAPSLTPNEGAKPTNTVQMTRAEWKATPRDYKIYSRKSGRFVMRHSPHGIGLFPVILIRAALKDLDRWNTAAGLTPDVMKRREDGTLTTEF